MNVTEEIDLIQKRLHDSGALWTRAELLRWYSDGYRQLLARSKAVRRFWIEDVPGRFTFAHTFEWEDNHRSGTHWRFSMPVLDATRHATSLWEAEFVEGLVPAASRAGITQPWERSYTGDTDAHFQFALPKDNALITRVAWDERLLTGVVTKELDQLESGWMREPGEPIVWTAGVGRFHSIELYEIRTDYQQGYALECYETGIPRHLTGARTYSAADGGIDNAYGYTNGGEAQALTWPASFDYNPTSLYTSDGADRDFAFPDRPFRLTFAGATDSADTPGLPYNSTFPWEINSRVASFSHGTYPWEKLHGAQNRLQADIRPVLAGYGRRATKVGSNAALGFGTQAWEIETLAGASTFTVGAVVGTARFESAFGAASFGPPLGTFRSASSPDRQYLPLLGTVTRAFLGTAREWKSSALAVTVTQVVTPERDLLDTDEPGLIPAQLRKYLRRYVWSRAFGRQGEGHQAALATHYEARFLHGVRLFGRLADVAHKDRAYARAPSSERQRPPRVRLPSNFPAVGAM